MELDTESANGALLQMLAGACLDSFSVTSISISLRFINPVVIPGESLYVDVDFVCAATIRENGLSPDTPGSSDFFDGRSEFLARVFFCIGKTVDATQLQADGRLSIVIDAVVIELCVSVEDDGQDDSVWDVSVQRADAGHLPAPAIACVPDGSGVRFLVDSESRSGFYG
ncbi:hypothetical protein H9654_08140 [Stenotrophomonas sp. Sa5BUN4]|uniref:Uncharacterized protein n=1 Tax=Stenotrophomonas lacuserhaii TaxID=2760084 RepID=A0A8X8K2P3_9GAMM|nr:hypothetical protein [Stenotrophomonas pennii]MBD7954175.1 hypothetical protein [Stenotrophomonas pennii]